MGESQGSRMPTRDFSDAEQNSWIDEVTFTLNDEGVVKSTKRSLSRSKKEHPRLDLSRLFMRRKSSKTSEVTSPLDTPGSAAHDPVEMSPEHGWHQTTNPWGMRIRKTKSSMATDVLSPQFNSLDLDDSGMQSPKIHVRRPPPGIQYWFDGVDDVDTSSVKSEPEGLSSLSPKKSLSRRNRDTFLSISTGFSQFGQEAHEQESHMRMDQPLNSMDDYSVAARPTRTRADTLTISPKNATMRPMSKRSRSSVSTIREFTERHRLPTPPKHRHLPDSIDRGQSVLVLSEAESEDDERHSRLDYLGFFDDATHHSLPLRDIPRSAPRFQSHDGLRADHQRQNTDLAAKRLNNVPDLISNTSIEEGSQMSDDHSPRTSLLSDIRPVSFRSDLQSFSYKTHDRPISISTYENDDYFNHRQHAWLTSPTATASQITSPPDLTGFLSESYLQSSSGHSPLPSQGSPQPQRVMVVTDEEARLLASMRRRRAQMNEQRLGLHSSHGDELRKPSRSPLTHNRRPSTADPSLRSARDTAQYTMGPLHQHDAQQTSKQEADEVSSPSDFADEAARLSPVAAAAPQVRRRPSTDTVSQVWEEVQHWRRRPSTPGSDHPPPPPPKDTPPRRTSRRPSLPHAATTPPSAPPYMSHFSPDTASPHSRATVAQRMASEGIIHTRTQTGWSDESPVLGHKNRSHSLGDALRKRREKKDVQEDVLAAWGDLGGWRRSLMSNYSALESSNAL